MPRRSKFVLLPAALREEFDARLIASGFSGYLDHAAWLKHQGYAIGKSAAHRYGAQLERKLQGWRTPVTASQKIDAALQSELKRVEQNKIRQSIGVLVVVIDPPTRETTVYATTHAPSRARALIEDALFITGRQPKQK